MIAFLKQVAAEYRQDEVPRRAAALAFYTILSLAPLLLLVVGIADIFLSGAQERVVEQATGLIGEQGGTAVRSVLANASVSGGNLAVIMSIALLLVGASAVFAELRTTMNRMWEVQPKTGVKSLILKRLFGVALVLALGFLLLVSLIASAAISMMSDYLGQFVTTMLIYTLELLVSLIAITGIFTALFRYVPETFVPWKAAAIGAAASAILFLIGKSLIGIYLGRAIAVSAYGAAGSLVVILLWAYYTAQILFIGAEVTQVLQKQQ